MIFEPWTEFKKRGIPHVKLEVKDFLGKVWVLDSARRIVTPKL